MKNTGNNGKGNNNLRDGWKTPNDIFEPLNKQFNFTFDCCANEEDTKCETWSNNFLEEHDIKKVVCWMNPPFSISWKMFEHFFKVVDYGVAIYWCDNFETALWQKIIFPNASWIFIPNKRVNYEGLDGEGARFPSALIGFGVEPPKELNGTCLICNR